MTTLTEQVTEAVLARQTLLELHRTHPEDQRVTDNLKLADAELEIAWIHYTTEPHAPTPPVPIHEGIGWTTSSEGEEW